MKPTDHPIPIRKLKTIVLDLLRRPDFEAALEKIQSLPPRRAVNPLFSFLYHQDPLVRWRAVTALGAVTAALADTEMESARVVFRRLMWNLNDESGGIGWGSVEVMGEILALNRRMRDEYLPILISYLRPEGNYLEHEGLQAGLLWAVGRVAQVDPAPLRETAPLIEAHLGASNPGLRGMAAWACGCMADAGALKSLEALSGDAADIALWIDRKLFHTTVGKAAIAALAKIRNR